MNFMLQVLQTVLLCSLVVVIVWVMDWAIKKRTGYRWRKILWLVLAIRLLLPFPINLSAVVDSFRGVEVKIDMPKEFLQEHEENGYQVTDDLKPDTAWQSNGENVNVAAGGTEPVSSPLQQPEWTPVNNSMDRPRTDITAKENIHKKVTLFDGIIVLWAIGALTMLGIKVIQYHLIKKKYLEDTVLCEDEELLACRDGLCRELGIKRQIPIRIMGKSDSLTASPMLLGYFRTTLLLPDGCYSPDEREAILRHELTHYASKDLQYKLMMVVICEIYWFDPILRLMKNMAFHDVECVCDEKVTNGMSLEARQDYSTIILKVMSRVKESGFAFTTQFAGTKKRAKNRFENIFSAHNRKIGIVMLALFLSVFMAGTACVSVKVAEDGENTEQKIVVLPEAETQPPEILPENKVITIDADILGENGEALLAELAKKYPDYTINAIEPDYRTKEFWEQPPTVFRTGVGEAPAFVETGRLADITEILEKRGWLEAMNDEVKAIVSDEEGRVYGIPAVAPYAWGLIVNVEMFREAGLVDEEGVPLIPQTWEELARTAVKIKEMTGQAGLCLIGEDYLGSLHFCNMAWNFGAVELVSREPDGSFTAHLDSEEAIAAMEFVKDLKWEYDVLTENPRSENYNTGYEHLANRTAAMFIGANDALAYLAACGMNLEDIAMGAVPAGPGGEQYSLYGGSVYVFPKDTPLEEIELVLDLLEMQGLGPVLNEAGRERRSQRVQSAVAQGVPAILEIPVWSSAGQAEYEQEILAQYGNAEQKLFQSYFDKVLAPGNLKTEDMPHISALYSALSDVLVQVMTDPDADVAELMKQANDTYQTVLDLE